jgi:FkbM family methyltransferase
VRRLSKLAKFTTLFSWIRTYENWPVPLRLALVQSNRIETIRTRDGLLALVRPRTNDFGMFHAVYAGRMYAPRGFEITPNAVVLDIGANIGAFSLFAARIIRSGAGRVFAFEPVPANFQLLARNIELNGLQDTVIPSACAVWSTTGTVDLYVSDDEDFDGLQLVTNTGKATGHNDLAAAGAERLNVPAVSLEDIVARHNIEAIDLLKLDCEGAEYEILFSASQATVERIRRVVMEVHATRTYGRRDLEDFLSRSGFTVSGAREYLYATRRPFGEAILPGKPDGGKLVESRPCA